jgi:hypothetical protein
MNLEPVLSHFACPKSRPSRWNGARLLADMAVRRRAKPRKKTSSSDGLSLDELYPLIRDASSEETSRFFTHWVRLGILSESEASSFTRLSQPTSRTPKTFRENVDYLQSQVARFTELKQRQTSERRALALHIEQAYRDGEAWKGFPLPAIAEIETALLQAEHRAGARVEKARRRAHPDYRQRAMDLDSFMRVTSRLWGPKGGRPPSGAKTYAVKLVSDLESWVDRVRRQLSAAKSRPLRDEIVRRESSAVVSAISGDPKTDRIGKEMAKRFATSVVKPRTSSRGVAIRMTAAFLEVSERTVVRSLTQ